jgi:pyruvate ferredoxin oxidoreductase alpha subunit/phenylglyoxylate dehydrogenase alpha subunit
MTAAAVTTGNNKPAYVVCEGNEAAAIGVGLSRPDVVAVYPITPQSSLVEHLSQMIADGRLRADLMNVEGEHAVLNGLQGVALAGGRTFTATCGPGIAFMFEPYVRTPGLRLPMVATLVTRDLLSPQCVWGGQQDAMVVREAGWIQMYCETVQEILDTTVMAYKIAEHHDVMLPVNVCHDGNYLSFGVTRVELPDQQAVDDFLGPPNINWHIALDPERPMGVDPLTGGAGGPGPRNFVRYRKGQCRGMQNSLRVIREVHAAWGERFSRYHAPLIEEYRLDDADYALVTIGSMTGAAKDAVDIARNQGERVGLIKVKTFRPFPLVAMASALAKVSRVGVVDRSVSFGWNSGPVFQETLSALYCTGKPIPAISFIGGLAGADITDEHFARAIALTRDAKWGRAQEPIWLNEND